MVDKIHITEELRDYIELLHFEKMRYTDLLKSVRRDSCPMTDEEWNSSLEYFQEKCKDAMISYQAMTEFINETYRDEIAGRDWFVDFIDRSIKFPPDKPKEPTVEEEGNYSDQMGRLYPEFRGSLTINDKRCKNITLQVTDACNLACTYCYQHNKGCHSMSFETAKRFIDMILDADERTNSYITSTESNGAIIEFIGGEPWLEIDLIAKISDYIIGELFRRKHPWAIKFILNVCSNGMLHFDERVQKYLKEHAGHLYYSISIDGDKKLHDSCRVDHYGNGSYDRAMAAVQQYRDELHGKIGSKMTIAPANVEHVGRAVTDMIEHGYNHINLNCVYEEGWTNEHAKELYWQLHYITDYVCDRSIQDDTSFSIMNTSACHPMFEDDNNNWCGGAGLMLAVDYKGDIYPCLRYMESSVGNNVPAYIIGNVDIGINKLPEHCDRIKCMECVTRKSQSTDECWSCPIASGCGWCSAYNYECFGTLNKRATYICCMHKARSLATYYYWKRRGEDVVLHCPKEWAIEIIGEEEYNNLISM